MSNHKLDNLYDEQMSLIISLRTTEGIGWRDDEKFKSIMDELVVVQKEIEDLELAMGLHHVNS